MAGETASKAEILGIKFDNIDLSAAVAIILSHFDDERSHVVITANPETVMRAKADQKLADALHNASLVLADGMGIVWASKVLKTPLAGRVAGADLVEALLDQGRIRPFRVYLLGSKPGVTERAADNIAYRFKGVEVIGYHHGYFSAQEKDHLIQDIKMLRPHLLLVGLGVPLQEIFLYENLNQMHVPVGIGIGGTIDVLSGMVKRAPLPIRRLGLEWAYRIVKQPRRFKRGLAIPRFIWAVCRETLTRQTTGQ